MRKRHVNIFQYKGKIRRKWKQVKFENQKTRGKGNRLIENQRAIRKKKQSVLTYAIRLLRMIPFDVFLNQDKTKIK